MDNKALPSYLRATESHAYDVEEGQFVKCVDGWFREVEVTIKYKTADGLRIAIKPVNFPSYDYHADDIVEIAVPK